MIDNLKQQNDEIISKILNVYCIKEPVGEDLYRHICPFCNNYTYGDAYRKKVSEVEHKKDCLVEDVKKFKKE